MPDRPPPTTGGGVFDRLSNPALYTGVYAERFRSGGRINADSDAHPLGASRATSGHTNEGTGQVVHNIGEITRQYLNVDRDVLGSPTARAAERARARLDAAERELLERAGLPPASGRGAQAGAAVAPQRQQQQQQQQLDTNAHLRLLYNCYCRSGRGVALGGADEAGAGAAAGGLDGAQWARLMRDCPGLLDGDRVSTTSTDLVYAASRDRATRRLGYLRFLDALAAVAVAKFAECDDAASAFSLLLSQHVFRCVASLGLLAALTDGTLHVAPLTPASGSSSSSASASARSGAGAAVSLAPHLLRPSPPVAPSPGSPRPPPPHHRHAPAGVGSEPPAAAHHRHRLPGGSSSGGGARTGGGFTARELAASLSSLPASTFLSHPSVLQSARTPPPSEHSTHGRADDDTRGGRSASPVSPVQAYLEGSSRSPVQTYLNGGGGSSSNSVIGGGSFDRAPPHPSAVAASAALATLRPPADVYEAIARKAFDISLRGPAAVLADAAAAAAAAYEDAHAARQQHERGDKGEDEGGADHYHPDEHHLHHHFEQQQRYEHETDGDGGRSHDAEPELSYAHAHAAARAAQQQQQQQLQQRYHVPAPTRFDLDLAIGEGGSSGGGVKGGSEPAHSGARAALPLLRKLLAPHPRAPLASSSSSSPSPLPARATLFHSSALDASPPQRHEARRGRSRDDDEWADEPSPPARSSSSPSFSSGSPPPSRVSLRSPMSAYDETPVGPGLSASFYRHPPTPGGAGATVLLRGLPAHPHSARGGGGGGGGDSRTSFSASLRGELYASSPHHAARGESPTSLAASPPRAAPSATPRGGGRAAATAAPASAAAGAPSPRPGYGEPGFQPTLPGAANAPGGVYDRLSSPRTFTGVYRRALESGDGRINAASATMVSALRSRYAGHTNAGSDEVISDLRGVLRPNLCTGRNFK